MGRLASLGARASAWAVTALVLVLAGGVAGCRVYDPALVEGGGCNARRPPPRPTVDDSADGPDVAFAMRMSFLDQGSEWVEIGYDVDGYCTTRMSPTSECMTTSTDGTDGIDNVFGDALYPLVESTVPGLEALAQNAQEEGRGEPILYVRGWNGTPNDPRVDFAIMQAVFTTSSDGATPDDPPDVIIDSPTDYRLASGSPIELPNWDGTDWAWVRDDAFLANNFDQPLIRDDNAYVADGVFVAAIPAGVEIIFPTETTGVLVRLTGAIATGVLSADGTALDPVYVSGRWSIIDLLATAENVGICAGSTEYNILSSQLNRIADVRRMPPDPPDPASTCNAVSIGVRFSGTRLRIARAGVGGGLTPGIPLGTACGTMSDGGMDLDAGVGADAGGADGG